MQGQTSLFDAPTIPVMPKERHVMGTRERIETPEQVKDSWFICNAPRPLYGDVTWNGPFLGGVFYAAVDPQDENTAFCLKRNAELDSRILIFHTKQELIELACEWYKEHYLKAYENIDLDDKDHVAGLVRKALDILNDLPDEG